jgi:hypothetical protein
MRCCCGHRTCPTCGGSGVIPVVPWGPYVPWVPPWRPPWGLPVVPKPLFQGNARFDAARARS